MMGHVAPRVVTALWRGAGATEQAPFACRCLRARRQPRLAWPHTDQHCPACYSLLLATQASAVLSLGRSTGCTHHVYSSLALALLCVPTLGSPSYRGSPRSILTPEFHQSFAWIACLFCVIVAPAHQHRQGGRECLRRWTVLGRWAGAAAGEWPPCPARCPEVGDAAASSN